MLNKYALPKLSEIIGERTDHEKLCFIGGSFVKFLYENHGREKFRRLWLEFNVYEYPWEEIYWCDLDSLDAGWRKSLNQ